MRGNKKFLLLFALLLSSILAAYFISGCGDDSTIIEGDQDDIENRVIGTIHGTVTSLTNGALMEGVEVIWINGGVSLYDTTDANGYFSTPTDLPSGDYEFTFRVAGYAIVTVEDAIPTLQDLLDAGDNRTGLIEVSETLDAALPQLTAGVTGAIYTGLPLAPEKGESPDLALDEPRMAAPVNGAVVQLDFSDNAITMHPHKYWDTTDADGDYVFAGLPLVDDVDFILLPFSVGDTDYVGFAINNVPLDGGSATFPNVYAVTTGNAHTTDNPVVLSYNFENDGFDVATALTVTFSEPMNTGTFQAALTLAGNAIDATLAWSTGDQVLTINPDLTLLTGSDYVLTLAGYSAVGALVLQDPIAAADGWNRTLTSQDGMRYVSSTLELTDFPLASAIGITFDMDPVWPDAINTDEFVALLAAPYGVTDTVETNLTASGATLTVTPVSALSSNTNYRLTFKVYSALRGDFVETADMIVGLGTSAPLQFLTVNTGTLPTQVTGFVIDATGQNALGTTWVADFDDVAVDFKWLGVDNADTYEIWAKNGTTVPDFVQMEVRVAGGAAAANVAHQDHLTMQVGWVQTAAAENADFDIYGSDGGLITPYTAATVITYKVRAVNSVGDGPFSDPITIADQTPPADPTPAQDVSVDATDSSAALDVTFDFSPVEYLSTVTFDFIEGGGDVAYVPVAGDVVFTFSNDKREGDAVLSVAATKAAVADTMAVTITDDSGNDTTYYYKLKPYITFSNPSDTTTATFKAPAYNITWDVFNHAGASGQIGTDGDGADANLDLYISFDGGVTWTDSVEDFAVETDYTADAGTKAYTFTAGDEDTLFAPAAMFGLRLDAAGFIYKSDAFVYGGLKWNIGATDSTAIVSGDSTYYDRNGTDSSFVPISFQSCGLDSILVVWSVDNWTNVKATYDTVIIADPTVVTTTAFNQYPWGTGADVAAYRLAVLDLEGAFASGLGAWDDTEEAPREVLGYPFVLTHDYVALTAPAPAGGTEVTGGKGDYTITWTVVGDSAALVDIWYFETANDNEWANWDDSTLLVAATANDGSWGSWAIPGSAPSATAKILMLDADGDSLFASTNVFTVSGWSMTTPATDILVGEDYDLVIAAVGTPGQADLYFSGTNFTDSTLVVADLAQGAVKADWTTAIQIADATRVAPTDSAKFRIWGDLGAAADTVYTTCTAFSYEGYLLTGPDSAGYGDSSGTDLMAGVTSDITWTSVGDATHDALNIDLDYSLDGVSGPWVSIVDNIPNSGTFAWPVPNTLTSPTNKCQVRVTQTGDANSAANSDTVTIAGVKFTYPVPAGTSSWSDDAGCTLAWTLVWHNYTFGNLYIEYSTNGGASWIAVPGAASVDPDNVTTTTGTHAWAGDEALPNTATYYVKARETIKAIWYVSGIFAVVD